MLLPLPLLRQYLSSHNQVSDLCADVKFARPSNKSIVGLPYLSSIVYSHHDHDTGLPVAGLQVSRTQWTLSTHFFIIPHVMNFLRILMSSCLPWMAILGVSDVLPISDRFLRPLDGACVTHSLTDTRQQIASLTMKIGYRLDTSDVG